MIVARRANPRGAGFQPAPATPRGAGFRPARPGHVAAHEHAPTHRGAGFQPARPGDVTAHESVPTPRGAGFQPARPGHVAADESVPTPRGAGFQPARADEPRLRRPKHHDLGRIPYFVTTRTHRHERLFVDSTAKVAVAELFRLRELYRFLMPAFVYMPDHAHFVVVPARGFDISQTMRVIKGGVARAVNAALNRQGAVWQDGFRDDAPRSLEELHAYISYIEQNPVRAGLVDCAVGYAFSSAGGRCEGDYQAFFALERDDAG